MTEISSDKWIRTPSKEFSPQDTLFSSSISKKIRRSFFKKDVAVKSYKCDFSGSDIYTAAKIYISNTALYVVHRPKRRKLTTISFATICDMKPTSDEQGVDVHLESGLVYNLHNFQRTECAVAFLLNFWNLVRKDKFTSPGPKSLQSVLENSGSSGRFSTTSCDARLSILPSDTAVPRLLKVPTTISLNSTASVSETGSLDERCRLSGSSSGLKCSSNETRSQPPPNSIDREASDSVTRHPSERSSVVRRTLQKVTRTPDPSKRGQSPLATSQNNSKKSPDREVTQHSASTPFLRAETTAVSLQGSRHPSGASNHPNDNQQVLHATSNGRPKPVVCLTESPGWGATWPLSFLPYPFSNPPQRLTMLIAYAILAFLFLSTLHLYHRLAVFDLRGGPSLARTAPRSPLITHEYRAGLDFLEIQLVELVNLVGQLTESLVKLTTELRSLDPIETSHVIIPPPAEPAPFT